MRLPHRLHDKIAAPHARTSALAILAILFSALALIVTMGRYS